MRIELAGAVAAVCATAPASAFAVDYMSAEQAAHLMFPDADRFETRAVVLDAAQLQALAAHGINARSARWPVTIARHGAVALGYVVSDAVVGKFELIGYAVGIDLAGAVTQVEILYYRESHGGEIRLPAWRRQFAGKTVDSPIRVGEDIANISGATLSCSHVTDGVRRIVAVVQVAAKSGSLV
jgi:Na+-translocating ferredoxin:NAD+ oxidoreductase RnfG subunit